MTPFASHHADTALMVVSATVILSCFINKPEALQGAYGSFLNKHGGKSVAHYRAVQSVCLAKTNRETGENVVAAANLLYPDNATARDALLEAAAAAATFSAASSTPSSGPSGTCPTSSLPSSDGSINDPAMRALRAKLYGMILHPGQSAVEHWAGLNPKP
jgi:hypothetical protein